MHTNRMLEEIKHLLRLQTAPARAALPARFDTPALRFRDDLTAALQPILRPHELATFLSAVAG